MKPAPPVTNNLRILSGNDLEAERMAVPHEPFHVNLGSRIIRSRYCP